MKSPLAQKDDRTGDLSVPALLRVLMIGDVVGEAGLEALEAKLPGLIREYDADFVVVNGENAAEGFGMIEANLSRILAAGADVVTSGNHVWEKREFWPLLEGETRMLRPANYPAACPGRGWVRVEKGRDAAAGSRLSWLVVNLQGRDFMPSTDCPFKTFDAIAESLGGSVPPEPFPEEALPEALSSETIILVDFHAESTREKEALAFYLDGRASLVAGTHTHVQTADERILPQGTGYITDLGMTGPTDSIIGMDLQICLDRARTQVSYRMECAKGDTAIQGIIAEIDRQSRRAVSIRRINQ
jgi:metallophosphoesterase (TIGR00282 family)